MSKYSGLYLWKRDSGKKTGRLAEFESQCDGGLKSSPRFPATSQRSPASKVSNILVAHSVTLLLEQWNHGDREALDKLM